MKIDFGPARRSVATLALALCFAAGVAPRAEAHHSFASEFDSNLEGTVKGVVTRVWWQNPHIRYDVTMKMPDGSTQEWALLPPGNLPIRPRHGAGPTAGAGGGSPGAAGWPR